MTTKKMGSHKFESSSWDHQNIPTSQKNNNWSKYNYCRLVGESDFTSCENMGSVDGNKKESYLHNFLTIQKSPITVTASCKYVVLCVLSFPYSKAVSKSSLVSYQSDKLLRQNDHRFLASFFFFF